MAEQPLIGENGGPDVPIIPDADLSKSAKDVAAGLTDAGTWTRIWVALWAGVVEGLKVVITLLIEALEFFMTLIAEFVLVGQGEKTTQFYKLVGAITSDLTGVEVDASAIQNAHAERGRIGGMQQVGVNLFNLLAREFIGENPIEGLGSGGTAGTAGLPSGQVTPDTGVKAAQAFMGFLMSFAIRQGNISVLTQFLSANGWLGVQEFREYGEIMAKNLGLGRLSRRALQPLIQIMIGE